MAHYVKDLYMTKYNIMNMLTTIISVFQVMWTYACHQNWEFWVCWSAFIIKFCQIFVMSFFFIFYFLFFYSIN